MFFHSYGFIFIFLPIAVFGCHLFRRHGPNRSHLYWLIAASFFFYWWSVGNYVLVLILSVVFNYLIATLILKQRKSNQISTPLLILGILGNLAMLGYFKYTNFFLENLSALAGTSFTSLAIILPLGLSFFTFQQISYLIDAHGGQADPATLPEYLLFVSFFPHVTAGPIVHHKEMLPQYAKLAPQMKLDNQILPGVTLFAMGLFKKVVIADGIAHVADDAFGAATAGQAVTFVNAWGGALAYPLQLYFDFSGYSDMAIGAALLLGIMVPLNFNSPYKARSIVDFWRRWHITLTRFFTNYLFYPMATRLTRRGGDFGGTLGKRYAMTVMLPVMGTFLLAGLWHGAGWTFVVFGLIHGAALSINHGWRMMRAPALPGVVCWLLTAITVVISMVFFRAESLGAASAMLQGMLGLSGVGVPTQHFLSYAFLAAVGVIVLVAPNSQELLGRHRPALDDAPVPIKVWWSRFGWQPSALGVSFTAVIFGIAVLSLTKQSAFLYYQF
jgi:alginate O-acetyltransferase complex protein AlgI